MNTFSIASPLNKFVSAAFLAGLQLILTPTHAVEKPDDEKTKNFFTFTMENDVVSNADRYYTSGSRFAYLFGERREPSFLRNTAERMGIMRHAESKRYELAFGQQIYTPENTDLQIPLENDRPYAGWLYTSLGVVAQRGSVVDQMEINLGVVGPAALAEETQRMVHRWIDSGQSQGWDYQLENEPTLQVTFQRNCWILRDVSFAGLQWHAFPHIGASIGNVALYSNAGLTVSIGSGKLGSFGLPRIGLVLPGNGYFRPGNGFSWQAFASLEGVAIGHNIFLDGSLFRSEKPAQIEKQTFVGEAQLGIQFVMHNYRLSYTYINRSREFREQQVSEGYGALSFTYAF